MAVVRLSPVLLIKTRFGLIFLWFSLVFGNNFLTWEIFWIFYLLSSQTYT